MACLDQMHPPVLLALLTQQVTPSQAWDLEIAQLAQLKLTPYGQQLMTWALLLELNPQQLTQH